MNIIGLVGPFGSGCSYVSNLISEKRGYQKLSLSEILKELFKKKYPMLECERPALQDFGNEIRKTKGDDYLAKEIWKKIDTTSETNFVIDSIRNPGEIEFLRNKSPHFFLFGVFADQDVRWERVTKKYAGNRTLFETDDERDNGEKQSFGQRVADSFLLSDIVIINNDKIIKGNDNEKDFIDKIVEKVDLVEKKITFLPEPKETYMAMAYAISIRSSCLKRKVGALIVDNDGAVISSGYNEVPSTQKNCKSDYGNCYRDYMKNQFREDLNEISEDQNINGKMFESFKKHFKILDYCRALHAEENAILGVARTGSSAALPISTLYTTTYPCNLCANKIAQVGIKKIVYFEPYPMKEAKAILAKQRVQQEPFEGVTYNAYFRLMEVTY